MAKYIYKHRRGSAAQWADHATAIPHEGEIVIELDEINGLHKLKIGDGVHTYAELAYLKAGDEIVSQVLTEVKPRIITVELTTNWSKASDGKYSQAIALDNITANSRLDLQPTADMIAEFKQLGLAFVTENNGGAITLYSVGNMPTQSYTMQATIVETECNGQNTVVGIPVGASAAQSDWTQTDDTKSDYIKNKPTLGALAAKNEVAKTDLASDVQMSLGKADTAIQSIDGLATEDYVDNKVGALGGLAGKSTVEKTDLSTDVQASLNKADTAIQSIAGLATESYVDSAISAIPTPDVSGQIGTHNTATNAHNDIRALISELSTAVNNFLDVDDATTDQLSEVLTLINNNKGTLESLTTSKVNVSDIINNLTTNVTNKPLSAAQGVALKALVDNLPTAEYVDNAVAQKSQVQFVIWGADD